MKKLVSEFKDHQVRKFGMAVVKQSFHTYQTGNQNDIRQLSEEIKAQQKQA